MLKFSKCLNHLSEHLSNSEKDSTTVLASSGRNLQHNANNRPSSSSADDSNSDDYNIAWSKARRAEETSDLAISEDECVSNKKRRIIIRRMYSSDGEENDTVYYKTPPKLNRKLHGNSQKGNMSQDDHISNINIETKINAEQMTSDLTDNFSNSDNDQSHRQTPMHGSQIRETVGESAIPASGELCTCCPHTAKYLKEILRQQHLTRALLNDLFQRLEEKGEREPESGSSSVFKDYDCPLKTKEELEAFNEHFRKQEHVADAFSEIARFGVSTTYDFVKRALTFFISNDLAIGYSWLRRRTKDSFSNLALAQLIIAAAEKAHKATDRKSIEEAISKWLRRAGDRQKHI